MLAWRKWFHKQGQSGHWRQLGREAKPAPDLAREQLLDRFHQHTKNCPSCSKVHFCLLLSTGTSGFPASWEMHSLESFNLSIGDAGFTVLLQERHARSPAGPLESCKLLPLGISCRGAPLRIHS